MKTGTRAHRQINSRSNKQILRLLLRKTYIETAGLVDRYVIGILCIEEDSRIDRK